MESDSSIPSSPQPLELVGGPSPSFSTTIEDMERDKDPQLKLTPMITDGELANIQVGFDVDVQMPSPLSDTGSLSQILVLEGTAWASEFIKASEPILLMQPLCNEPIHRDIAPSSIPSTPSSGCSSPRPLPAISKRLKAAGAPFWAATVCDVQNCLWAKMSQRLVGRKPTKTLFNEIFTDAVTRQGSFSPVWQRGT